MNMSALDVLVVGGGISGLAVAHSLARSGLAVEVWEGAERVGGKIRTVQRQGYRLESAASMVVNLRGEIDNFLRGCGLEASKRARAPTAMRYVLDADQLHEVPTRLGALLTTPLFSTLGKLRLLAEPLARRGSNPEESVAEFVIRRLGKEFLEKAFEPYVAGPLASDVDLAEARATTPRLAALEKQYGSLAIGALLGRLGRRGGAGRPEMFSFAGGMQTLVDVLARAGGFRVREQLRVSEVWPVSGGWMTKGVIDGAVHTAFSRQLVLSLPADAAASVLEGLDGELAGLLRGIEYAPVNVVHTAFDRSKIAHPLNGSGFLVPRRSAFAANGCLWMSSLFPDHAPQGRVLFSTYVGGARNPGAASWSAARTSDVVAHMLREVLGVVAAPEMLHIESHARALPLYHGRYSQRLADVDQRLASLPGLYLEANYKGGVSVRDRILCAAAAASRILRYRETAAPRRSGPASALGGVVAPAPVALR
ncbi:MAG: protoporphyrinogen oxidase [Burkholderiaceae bacterium]